MKKILKCSIIFFAIIVLQQITFTSKVYAAGMFDDVCSSADNFVNQGEMMIDKNELSETNATLFNLLYYIGVALSVGVGGILGIKYMLASAEDKAKIKESMMPYVAGCIVIFGAFTIWKVIVDVLGNI